MTRWLRSLLPWLLWLALAGCEGASSDPGLRTALYVRDAQFVPGPLPRADDTGPALVSVRAPHGEVQPGVRGERVVGALAPEATAVALGLEDDVGYWIVAAGVPALEEPELPTFAAALWFMPRLRGDRFTLLLRAVDAAGHFGEESTLTLTRASRPEDAPLVVRLRWANAADLDLHVRAPGGEEIWAGNINSAKAPPVGSIPQDPNAWMEGAILDVDANAGCVQDTRREENVVWNAAPSSGSYQVHVASASLCGESAAHWSLEVWRDGERVAEASGIALPSDVWDGARRGDGVHALSFEVP
jgi:hypothetical protein